MLEHLEELLYPFAAEDDQTESDLEEGWSEDD